MGKMVIRYSCRRSDNKNSFLTTKHITVMKKKVDQQHVNLVSSIIHTLLGAFMRGQGTEHKITEEQAHNIVDNATTIAGVIVDRTNGVVPGEQRTGAAVDAAGAIAKELLKPPVKK